MKISLLAMLAITVYLQSDLMIMGLLLFTCFNGVYSHDNFIHLELSHLSGIEVAVCTEMSSDH